VVVWVFRIQASLAAVAEMALTSSAGHVRAAKAFLDIQLTIGTLCGIVLDPLGVCLFLQIDIDQLANIGLAVTLLQNRLLCIITVDILVNDTICLPEDASRFRSVIRFATIRTKGIAAGCTRS